MTAFRRICGVSPENDARACGVVGEEECDTDDGDVDEDVISAIATKQTEPRSLHHSVHGVSLSAISVCLDP